MSLVLPGWVAQSMARERMVDATLEAIPYWNRLLKDIDDRLSLVWVNDRLQLWEAQAIAPELIPGRWHVKRRNDGVKDSYKPIITSDGGYRPMASDILEELRANNLWHGEVARGLFEARRREEEARERASALRKEQRVHEMASAIKATDSPGVSFSDQRWTWRAGAKRGARQK